MPGDGHYTENTEGHVDKMAAGFAGGMNILLEKFDEKFSLVKGTKTDFDDTQEELKMGSLTSMGEVRVLHLVCSTHKRRLIIIDRK